MTPNFAASLPNWWSDGYNYWIFNFCLCFMFDCLVCVCVAVVDGALETELFTTCRFQFCVFVPGMSDLCSCFMLMSAFVFQRKSMWLFVDSIKQVLIHCFGLSSSLCVHSVAYRRALPCLLCQHRLRSIFMFYYQRCQLIRCIHIWW